MHNNTAFKQMRIEIKHRLFKHRQDENNFAVVVMRIPSGRFPSTEIAPHTASFLFHTNDVAYGVQKAPNEDIYGTEKRFCFGSGE